jgi:hypothetical protein
MGRAVTRIAAALLAVLLALQLVAIVRHADREPHPDEIEYLHAAWLMAHGETLYVTFFEHHPPFLFAALQGIVNDDVRVSFVRARLWSGAFGFVAMLAFAWILWRVRPEAVPIAVALLFASSPLWTNGLTAARAEPFAFAFFWCGAALVLLQSRDEVRSSIASGAGMSLVAIAALWNPKWPFCSVVVAAFWWTGTRRRMLSGATALALTSASVFVMSRLAPLDRVWFFSVEYTRALWPWLSRAPELLRKDFQGGRPFVFAPALLRPAVMLAAFLLVVAAILCGRLREKKIASFFLLIAIASALELRFTFPWPVLWNYYYLMWGFAAAALVGLVPAAIQALLARGGLRHARMIAAGVAAVAMLIAGAYVLAEAPFGSSGDDGPYWASLHYFQRRLQRDDTVWLDIARHPVAARDAGYYWFGPGYVIPVANELRATARGARFLPPVPTTPFCAIAAGASTRLRLVSPPRMLLGSPREQLCFQQLLSAGRIRPTPFPVAYEVVR